jgi:hypothetical protein
LFCLWVFSEGDFGWQSILASKRTCAKPLLTIENFCLEQLPDKIRVGVLAACAWALIFGVGLCMAAAQASVAGATVPASSSSAQASGQSHSSAPNRHSRHKSRHRTVRGQQKIDPERAQEIQEALIREHYLTGKPTGTWNQASEDAMRKYQGDHGWQSKTVPDSRALISLGLGPSHDHLLNPESAMTTGPDLPHSTASRSKGAPSADPPAAQTASQPAPGKGESNPLPTPPQSNPVDSSRPQ